MKCLKVTFLYRPLCLLYLLTFGILESCSNEISTQNQSELRLLDLEIKAYGAKIDFDEVQQHLHLYPQSVDFRVDLFLSGCRWQKFNWILHYPYDVLTGTWQAYRSTSSDFDLFADHQIITTSPPSSSSQTPQNWKATSQPISFNLNQSEWGFRASPTLNHISITPPYTHLSNQVSVEEISPSCTHLSTQRRGNQTPISQLLIQFRFQVQSDTSETLRLGIIHGPLSASQFSSWVETQNQSRSQESNSINPLDLVILNGDLFDSTTENLSGFQSSIESLKIPWLLNLGNDDLQATSLSKWEKTFGYLPILSEWMGIRLILLNTANSDLSTAHSSLREIGRFFDSDPLLWSDTDPTLLRFVFVHTPPLSQESTVSSFTRRIDAIRFLSFLDQYPSTYLISASDQRFISHTSTHLHQFDLPTANAPPLDLSKITDHEATTSPKIQLLGEEDLRWTELVIDRLCLETPETLRSTSCLEWIIH